MDFYIIPPKKHLDLMHKGNRYFCLAHFYLHDAQYRKYFLTLRAQQPTAFITLDNAAAEKSLIEHDALLNIVAELQPNEVVSPDYLLEKDKTMESLDKFATMMVQRGLDRVTKLFACPQADNKENWFDAFATMARHPLVSVLGLSKITVPYCFADRSLGDTNIASSRQAAVVGLLERGLLTKDIHLLGMGDPTEYGFYMQLMAEDANAWPLYRHLRSSDSCYSVLAAWHGVDFKKGDYRRIPTTDDFYEAQLTREQYFLAERNAEFLQQYHNNALPDK